MNRYPCLRRSLTWPCVLLLGGGLLAQAGTDPDTGRSQWRGACATEGAILLGEPCVQPVQNDVGRPDAYRPAPEWSSLDYTRPYWRTNLFKRVLTDQVYLTTTWWPQESRRFEFSGPMLVALTLASGSAGSGLDLKLQRSVQSWTSGGRRDVAETFTRLGDTETGALLLGSTYLISRWTGNARMTRATSLSAEALLNAGIYSTLLKKLTRRTRPSIGGSGEFFVNHPQAGQQVTSFPSGHAMGVFAVAAVFSSEYRHRRWVPWAAYGTAGLVAASRVGLGRHFPSDVLAGALLGHSLGRMVVRRNGGAEGEHPFSRLEPLIDPRNDGFGMAYSHGW